MARTTTTGTTGNELDLFAMFSGHCEVGIVLAGAESNCVLVWLVATVKTSSLPDARTTKKMSLPLTNTYRSTKVLVCVSAK